MSTVAGQGIAGRSGDGGPAGDARLDMPTGVAALPRGGFLIADQGNAVVRRVYRRGVIRTVAGTGEERTSATAAPRPRRRSSLRPTLRRSLAAGS